MACIGQDSRTDGRICPRRLREDGCYSRRRSSLPLRCYHAAWVILWCDKRSCRSLVCRVLLRAVVWYAPARSSGIEHEGGPLRGIRRFLSCYNERRRSGRRLSATFAPRAIHGTHESWTANIVYVDAQAAIYSVDVHPIYAPLCRPLWDAVRDKRVIACSSELTLLETIVAPLRLNDSLLAADREALWTQVNTRLISIAMPVLRQAAQIRAAIPGLKTPDAIHAATALLHHCDLFVTNDTGFRRVPGLNTVILDELIARS